jgi:hypothetical protein
LKSSRLVLGNFQFLILLSPETVFYFLPSTIGARRPNPAGSKPAPT